MFGADPKFFPPLARVARSSSASGGVTISNIQVIVLVTALMLMAGLEFIVMRTRFGRAMRAVSYDAPAAALMGIPVDRVILVHVRARLGARGGGRASWSGSRIRRSTR